MVVSFSQPKSNASAFGAETILQPATSSSWETEDDPACEGVADDDCCCNNDPQDDPYQNKQRKGEPQNPSCCASVVRFAGVSDVWSSDHKADIDLASVWYSPKEFGHFKATFLKDVKEVIKTKRRSVCRIGQAHDTLAANQASIPNTLEMDKKRNSTQELKIPLHGCVKAVGLEKLVIREIYRQKQQRRISMMEAVDDIQSNAKMFEEETRNTLLRVACESISEPSKLFAQYLGMATATASSPLRAPMIMPILVSSASSSLSEEEDQGQDDAEANLVF